MIVLALLLTGCSAGTDEPPREEAAELEGVQRFADLSTEHVEGAVSYDQTPPAGGAHNQRWLACDTYDEPVPSELAVHAMEHGGVWITYRPDLPAADVAELEALRAVDEEYVLVSPYDDLPAPVVATAWGLQLRLDSADDPRLEQFTRAYAGGDQGGEPGAPCREGGLSLEEAQAAVGD